MKVLVRNADVWYGRNFPRMRCHFAFWRVEKEFYGRRGETMLYEINN